MPEWEYLEINENNFDININNYVKEAYEKKAWAFVSDVARLWALYTYGGIYLDADVQVFKPLNQFLNNNCFTGFEQSHYPVTAVLGAEPQTPIIKEMLDAYTNKHFELKSNWHDYETNTMIMSDIIAKYIDRDKEEYQTSTQITVYPRKYFCYNNIVDNNTFARHLMCGSWGKL